MNNQKIHKIIQADRFKIKENSNKNKRILILKKVKNRKMLKISNKKKILEFKNNFLNALIADFQKQV